LFVKLGSVHYSTYSNNATLKALSLNQIQATSNLRPLRKWGRLVIWPDTFLMWHRPTHSHFYC